MHRRKGFRRRFSKEELNIGVHVCQCHRGIHALYDELTLATRFYNLELLLSDETLAGHFRWVANSERLCNQDKLDGFFSYAFPKV